MKLRLHLAACFVFLGPALIFAAYKDPLFDEKADANKEIQAAITQATRAHKNVVLDFGAKWCEDCHVLDAQMEKPELSRLIKANYVVVDIDVGRFDKNLDLAEKYHVPLKMGVPALAVLDSHGKLLYSQERGEFEGARRMKFEDFKAFFERCKPKK
ncbi:MAG TPA: thioredoxin family protein [Terriglobia bacterium]|nr:thioredoxin family protein [Terriglobia bacterium]